MVHAYVGTSGWNYREWRGSFYPQDLPAKRWLAFYASRFDSVEINYTFYRLPSVESCEAWYRQTPETFRFVVKASRYLTHLKRLKDADEAWDGFLERVRPLREKLGALLLQFPSNFRASEANLERIDRFLGHATRRGSRRLALEFRDPSCFEDEMLAILKRHRAALVISHSSRYPVPEPCPTADFSYFRFHGPKKWCASAYSHNELRAWAAQIAAMLAGRRDVYAFFNNDAGGHAPRDAFSLLKILQERKARTSPPFSASISRSHQ